MILYFFVRDLHFPGVLTVTITSLVVLGLAVMVGAGSQRATGIGFGLVVAPACALVLSGGDVVGTVVRLSLLADVLVFLGDRAHIDWRQLVRYAWPAALALPFAWLTTRAVSPPILIGSATLATLAVATVVARPSRWRTRTERADRVGGSIAGFASGFMGVTTGLSGPPLALHASSGTRSMAANRSTMALFFLVVDFVAILVHPHAVGTPVLGLLVVTLAIGILGGRALVGRVSEHSLRRAVLAIVAISAVAALVGVFV